MESCATDRVGRASRGAGQGQSGMALPSELDISSVLPFYIHIGAHPSWRLFLLPVVRCHSWERRGEGVCGPTPGSLRPMSPSVQQHFCSRAGTKPDVALPKRRQKDNRFDTSEIQHRLFSQCSASSVAAAVSHFSTVVCSYRNCCKQQSKGRALDLLCQR